MSTFVWFSQSEAIKSLQNDVLGVVSEINKVKFNNCFNILDVVSINTQITYTGNLYLFLYMCPFYIKYENHVYIYKYFNSYNTYISKWLLANPD